MAENCQKTCWKKMSNTEFVSEIMEFSNHGALIQCFVITALEKYSDLVLQDKSDWGNSFIDKKAWQGCAREILEKLKAKYSG